MRILILSSMVAASMAGCTSGNADMIVFSGYANDTNAAIDYTTGTPWGHTNAANLLTVREIFANGPNESSAAGSNGNIHGVPWPLATGGYNSGATTNVDFAIEIPLTATAVALTGAVCVRLNTAAVTDNTGGSCTAPQMKFYTNANCVAGEIASPDGAAGYVMTEFLANAGTGITASGIALYGKAVSATADNPTSHFVAAAGFKQIIISFFTNTACSSAVTASAIKIASQTMALFTNADATTNAATVPGRCVNVKKDVSFELFCDVPGGQIKHIGYANNGCTGTPATNNTTTWGPGAVDTLTNAEKCQAWKGYSNLYASISNSGGTPLTTSTLLAVVCPLTTTAAPTAAPASGAAAVGTAAAVAAGAAALIL